MTICPECVGDVDPGTIQLQEIEGDYHNYFYCKRCKKVFELKELDETDLDDDFIDDKLKEFLNALCVTSETEEGQ